MQAYSIIFIHYKLNDCFTLLYNLSIKTTPDAQRMLLCNFVIFICFTIRRKRNLHSCPIRDVLFNLHFDIDEPLRPVFSSR